MKSTLLALLFFTNIFVFAQEKTTPDPKKQALIIKIEKAISKARLTPPLQLYVSDIDSIYADVDRLNKIDLELSLTYYPKVNELRKISESSKIDRKNLLAQNYREAGQKEFYTLMSILEEDEKLNSFAPKDIVDIADRAFELMSDPENDLVYNERIYLIRGKAYFQLSNYYATILNLKKITAYEKDTSAIKYLALSYFNIGKYNEAERLIDKALILNQNDEDLIYGRFLVNKNKNHEPGMFADLLELLDAQPNNIKYLKLMGDYYFDQKKYLDAWVQYEKISKADPKNSFAWMLMGNCYLALNDKQSALSHFKKASFLGNLYVEKIIEGLENNFAFINDENVKFTINPSQSSKAILNLNTGFKVKIINEINEKIALCAVYGIENTDIIMGYIPTKNLSISLMGVPKAAINEKMPYSLPEKSPILKTPSTKIFYKEWLQQMPNIK